MLDGMVITYRGEFGTIEFADLTSMSVLTGMITALNELKPQWANFVTNVFMDDDVRRFLLCHARLPSGYDNFGARKNLDPLQSLAGRHIVFEEDDLDRLCPDVPQDISTIIEGFDVEPLSQDVFSEDITVEFCLTPDTGYERNPDVVVIKGLQTWPEDDHASRMLRARQAIAGAPVIVISCNPVSKG